MSQELAALQVSLELQSAQFTAEMAKVNSQLSGLNRSVNGAKAGMEKFGSVLKSAFAAGAVIAGIKSLADSVGAVADRFDDMGKAAQKIGIATADLSALNFAAEQSGVSFESLQTGVKKLSVGMSELNDSSSKAGLALRNVGVTAQDSTSQAFDKVAEALSKMPDGYQKTAAAIAIFGKSGSDLIPLLNEGEAGIGKMKDRAEELGLVMKDKTVAQLTLFNDSLNELRKSSEGLRNRIVEGLAPSLAGLAKTLADAKTTSDAWVAFGKKLGEIFVAVAEDINTMITDIKILALAVRSLSSRESLMAFWGERQKLIDQNNKFKVTLIENIKLADQLSGSNNNLSGTVTNLTGKFEAGAIEKWAEGLIKSADELDSIPEKVGILIQQMDKLKASGQEDSNIFKVLNEEYQKLNESILKGSAIGQIALEIEKTEKKARDAAEAFLYLEERLQNASSIEELLAINEVLEKMKGKVDETKSEFEKLGEGIADAIASNANNAVNSFIDSIGNAKISFGDFATSVLKDIAKMIVQMLVMKPLMDSIRGFVGGFSGGGGGGAQAFPVDLGRSTFAMPEPMMEPVGSYPTGAVMPSIGRMAAVAGSDVNVNVYNNSGSEVQTKTTENADGSKQIDIYIERKVREMISGGGVDRQMRGAYGLTRIGA